MSGNKTTVLAMAGKGGVGKTSLAALTVRQLCEAYPDKKILAIDADPAVGLATALGVEVGQTVDDIRKTFVETAESGDTRTAVELLGESKYRIFDALTESGNMSFLAIGRPEAAGCYCKVNTYLKAVISLVTDKFDYVVIDGEAGIEQVNRRVLEKVTDLILISDGSRKGLQVAETIHKVAEDLMMVESTSLILNRIPDGITPEILKDSLPKDIPVISWIPDDAVMSGADIYGRDVYEIPKDSMIYTGLNRALKKLDLLQDTQTDI